MKWMLILVLSLSGAIMGLFTLYFIPARYEAVVGTPLFLTCGWFIGRYATRKWFLHGFLLGVLNTVIVTAIRASFAQVYLAHHAADAEKFARMSTESGATVVQVMLMLGLFNALIAGLVMGFFAIIGVGFVKAIQGEKR
jgi:uncharacterized membrane protein YiaA